jgi:hypothetical protein
MEGGTGRHLPISATLLARLRELNGDYLELLCDARAAEVCGGRELPNEVVQSLARISPDARRVLAASPFALFTLRFADAEFWRHAIQSAAREPATGRYGLTATPDRPRCAFAAVALAFAWHVVQSDRMAARLLLGMSDPVGRCLLHAPLSRLERLAGEEAGIVAPRWSGNPRFWPDIMKFAAAQDWPKLVSACALGRQLTAADFETALRTSRKD